LFGYEEIIMVISHLISTDCNTLHVDYFSLNSKYTHRIVKNKYSSAEISKYMLFTGREVHIGKNCARGLEYGIGINNPIKYL